jgi:hypothetical protein
MPLRVTIAPPIAGPMIPPTFDAPCAQATLVARISVGDIVAQIAFSAPQLLLYRSRASRKQTAPRPSGWSRMNEPRCLAGSGA